MNTIIDHINAKGYIENDGHKIYWEDWGNPKAKPIFLMHGGPGGGFQERHKMMFNPKLHRVIFHDQRGSGRSLPFAGTENNNRQGLIKDIESLREYLHIDKMYVMGGSWGSTLSLLYSITHPERVERLLIWGIFLARQFEIDFVNEGYPRYFYTEAWERFIALVPETNRKSGNEVMKYYARMIESKDEEVARKYADEWTLWEISLCSVLYDPKKLESDTIGDKNNLAIARIEMHYFLNKCFVPENFILDNIHKIKHIPCSLIQGRFDMCTPPISALDLKRAYGDKLVLKIVNAGHLTTDPEMASALNVIIDTLLV